MYQSTKVIELGSCAFRQPNAKSHCRFIHGYRLMAKIWFNANKLDEHNWVMDFGGLDALKDELQDIFDHTLVIDINDPHIEAFKHLFNIGVAKLVIMHGGVGIEKFAEKVFFHAYTFANKHTDGRVWVSKVEVWEHEKNSAIFQGGPGYRVLKETEEEFPKNDSKLETLGLIPEEIKLEVSKEVPAPQENPHAAKVGNRVSSGWSNPFGGTSWGV